MTRWLAPLIAFVTASGVLGLLLGTAMRERILDRPNHRSLHQIPVPRTGGLAVSIGIVIGGLLIGGNVTLLICVSLLVAVSVLDDLRGLPPWIRFAIHLSTAAGAMVVAPRGMGPLQFICLMTLIAWMTNLYNFMDGSDGLAGGMTTIGFSFYAVAAWNAQDLDLAVLSLTVVTATLSFLVLNFSPARIFLGDAGSIPLGFLAGCVGIYGWMRGTWTPYFAVLVFSPFIVDATVTLLQRALKCERVWLPHRDHFYQRLIRMGWSHKKTALAEYTIMLIMGAMGLITLTLPMAALVMVMTAAIVIYSVLAICVNRAWHQQENQDSL